MEGRPRGGAAQYEQCGHRTTPQEGSPPWGQRLRLGDCGWRYKFQNDAADGGYRRNETVSETRQGFYVSRLTGGIAERLPELIDGGIEAMLEGTGSNSGPEAVAKSFSRQQVAGPLQQGA